MSKELRPAAACSAPARGCEPLCRGKPLLGGVHSSPLLLGGAAPRRTLGGSPENEVKYLIILLSDYFVLFRITMWCALKCQNL